MTAFPTHKLARLTATRNARADTINNAIQIAGENVYCLDAIITKTLPLVERESEEFFDYIGETLPPHAKEALEKEPPRCFQWVDCRSSLPAIR